MRRARASEREREREGGVRVEGEGKEGMRTSVIKKISYPLFAHGLAGEDRSLMLRPRRLRGRAFAELRLERGMRVSGPLSRPLGGPLKTATGQKLETRGPGRGRAVARALHAP